MKGKIFFHALPALILATIHLADAQQPKIYRIGVVTAGGSWYEVIGRAQGRSQTVGS